MSGGIEQGHLPGYRDNAKLHPNAEQRLSRGDFNLLGTSYEAKGMKQKTVDEKFTSRGATRIAKVRPVAKEWKDKNIPDYPPGEGIPQFTLTCPLLWVAAAFIRPGEKYVGTYV